MLFGEFVCVIVVFSLFQYCRGSEGVRNEISFEENEIEDRFMFRWKSRVIGGVY